MFGVLVSDRPLRIGIPSKGRLSELAVGLLQQADCNFVVKIGRCSRG